MSNTKDQNKLPQARMQRAIEGFESFCEENLEWRRNSGEPFDEAAFNDARDLVMRKIEAMKEDAQ